MCRGPLEQLPAERGIAYMGFSFIVTSIVLVICSSYRIHISLRAHDKFCSFCPDRDTSCFSLLSSLFSLLSQTQVKFRGAQWSDTPHPVGDAQQARGVQPNPSRRQAGIHAPRCRPSRLCGAAPALLHVWCRSAWWLRRCGRSRRAINI